MEFQLAPLKMLATVVIIFALISVTLSQEPEVVPGAAPVLSPASGLDENGGASGIQGTTTQTKNPDGSTITVTHFRGQLPQGAVVNPAVFGGVPFFGFPFGNANQGGPNAAMNFGP